MNNTDCVRGNMDINEKLAGQAGIKVLGILPAGEPEGSLWPEIDMTGFALYPGETVARRLCDFPSALNACFKWLEPPLWEKYRIFHIGFKRVEGVGYSCFMNREAGIEPFDKDTRYEGRSKELTTMGYGTTYGESFCDAALRVIERYPEYKAIEQLMEGRDEHR